MSAYRKRFARPHVIRLAEAVDDLLSNAEDTGFVTVTGGVVNPVDRVYQIRITHSEIAQVTRLLNRLRSADDRGEP